MQVAKDNARFRHLGIGGYAMLQINLLPSNPQFGMLYVDCLKAVILAPYNQ